MGIYDNGSLWEGGGSWDQGYSDFVTSEHQKPNFLAVMQALTQPLVDAQALMSSLPSAFDVDMAVGQQLDFTGQWVGESRNLDVPLTGVYFSFGTAGVGFGQGTWKGPFDPTTQLDALADDSYRKVLYAKIANNQWDGTVEGAYKFMEPVFPGSTFFIQDNQDMTMLVGVVGDAPLNAVSLALLTGGSFDIRPSGVRIRGYATPSVPGKPLFGFGIQNDIIGGFGVGCFATISGGN